MHFKNIVNVTFLMSQVLKKICAQHSMKQYTHCTNNFSVFQIYQRIRSYTKNNKLGYFFEVVTVSVLCVLRQ